MEDELGVVNMQGRIYDARVSRFMQADPLVSAPGLSQGWNRYSYALNNPMRYTDPSGFVTQTEAGQVELTLDNYCAVKGLPESECATPEFEYERIEEEGASEHIEWLREAVKIGRAMDAEREARDTVERIMAIINRTLAKGENGYLCVGSGECVGPGVQLASETAKRYAWMGSPNGSRTPRKARSESSASGEGIEVNAVENYDYVGKVVTALRFNVVPLINVDQMVKGILHHAGGRKIGRLNILDHGNANGMMLGSDWVDSSNLTGFLAKLSPLKGAFAPLGFIHLNHCMIGQNQPLMEAIANHLGVTVYAGTGYHNPAYRFNTGDYVVCYPGGGCGPSSRP
jgi:RHS repeat-associated protein